MSTLTWTSTWTELLEKIKNDLTSLKSSLARHITLTLKTQLKGLILEAKNTVNKYETAT